MIAFAVLLAALPTVPSSACRSAETQADVNACEWHAFQTADRALNVQWSRVLAAARIADVHRSPQDGGIDYEADLLAAERAWIGYRDTTCKFSRDQAGGGTIGPAWEAICRRQRTVTHTTELKDITQAFVRH